MDLAYITDHYPDGLPPNWSLACGDCGCKMTIDIGKDFDGTNMQIMILTFNCPHCLGQCSFISELFLPTPHQVASENYASEN